MIGHNARDGNKNRWADGDGRKRAGGWKRDRGSGRAEDPFGGDGDASGDECTKAFFFFFSLYLILFYLAPVFVQVRPIVPFGWFHAPVNTRRGRRFVKFLRSLIARLLAMQRERRAYYQLG